MHVIAIFYLRIDVRRNFTYNFFGVGENKYQNKFKLFYYNALNSQFMKRSKILVVDDSETNLVLLEAILEDDGFDVSIAYNVKEAETQLQKDIPNLILLDLLMPNENGFSLLQKLKSNEIMRDIPVIIVTAFANSENNIKAKHLGAADIIEKPINIPDFITKVHKALNQ